MKALHRVLIFAATAVAVSAANPERDVAAAVADLLRQENYSWSRAMGAAARGSPLAPLTPEELQVYANWDTEGRTQAGGLTAWTTKTAVTLPTVNGLNDGKKRIVNYGKGWVSVADLEAPAATYRQRATLDPRPSSAERWELLEVSAIHRHAVAGRVTPIAMLKAVAGELDGFKPVSGAIRARLKPGGVAQVQALVKDINLQPAIARDAYGTAAFWMEDGHLTRLEVEIMGYRESEDEVPAAVARRVSPRPPLTLAVKQVFAFTFARFGNSLLPVAPEAQEKLAAVAQADQLSSASAARP